MSEEQTPTQREQRIAKIVDAIGNFCRAHADYVLLKNDMRPWDSFPSGMEVGRAWDALHKTLLENL